MNRIQSLFLLTIFIALLSGLSVKAQEFSLGVKAGPLLTWSSFGDKDDNDDFTHRAKLGYMVRGLISFPLKDDYVFQAECGFSQRGRKILFNKDTWTNNGTYYFADASMMLRKTFPFKLDKNIPAKWYFGVGPQISYWIMGRGSVTAGGSYDYKIVFSEKPESPPEPDFNKMYVVDANRWLFGIDIGVGFTAPLLRSQKIQTEIRFTSGHTFYGTKTGASNRTLGFTDNMRSNEKVLSITASYFFDFNIQQGKKGKSTKDKEVHRKPVKRKH